MATMSRFRLPSAPLQTLLLVALATSSPSLVAAEDVSPAMKGYDPVAYFTLGKATKGAPQYEYLWDEQRYRFASAEHRELFRKSPGRYMPRFGNICAGALAYGLAWEANPENWVIYKDQLYLFGTVETREAFLKDPKPMIVAAGRNAKRLRKGEALKAELPFPANVRATAPLIIKQCRVTRGPDCPPESELAHFESLLNAQPPGQR